MESTMTAERSMVMRADRERVWKAITMPEQISKWFDAMNFGRLAVGETFRFEWGGEGEIAIVEPPERFGFRWQIAPPDPTKTLVVFTLETVTDGTRVTVTESGFEALPEAERTKHINQNAEGWDFQLGNLSAYLEREANA